MKTIMGDENKDFSFSSDKDLALDIEYFLKYDLYLNIAHVAMQYNIGSLKKTETIETIKLLRSFLSDNKLLLPILKSETKIEDSHTLIEACITKELGDVGQKVHLHRSRNDQVKTLIHLKMRQDILNIISSLTDLCETLLKKSNETKEILMPAFTHLQPAQPSTLGHYYMSKVEEIMRDIQDLQNLLIKINISPLGAVAIAGAPTIDNIKIDRQMTANLLGFNSIQENTIDAVSSSGEFIMNLAQILNVIVTLKFSRICEDLIVWSSMGMIKIGSKYGTSSSIMPQKFNPDIIELIRAKSGNMMAHIIKIATICKGTPTGYNRDFQEVKHVLIEAVNDVIQIINVMNGVLSSIEPNTDQMTKILKKHNCGSTDLANLITIRHQIPFRKSYLIVKKMLDGEKLSKVIFDITGKKIKIEDNEIQDMLDPASSVNRRNHIGAPNALQTSKSIKTNNMKLMKIIKSTKNTQSEINEKFDFLTTYDVNKLIK